MDCLNLMPLLIMLVIAVIFQDRSIAVWDMQSPTDINLRRVLVGHRAAVNVVDFDDKYIVSASGDRTIKVCNAYHSTTFKSMTTLNVFAYFYAQAFCCQMTFIREVSILIF